MSRPPRYALLADGSAALIRSAGPADRAAVLTMHEAMSAQSAYLRFFNFSTLAAGQEASRVCREPEPGHAALLAWCGDEVVGCASYERIGDGGSAEVAFAVADRMHHKGIATLLLEYLVAQARESGVSTFTADQLAENSAMMQVFRDAGLPARRRLEDGVIEVTIPLPRDDTDATMAAYLSAVDKREGTADVASLRHVLAPRSIAVIGAGQQPGAAGRAILDNIRTGGYQGQLYPVHPHARQLGGVRCVRSVAELPEAPDLAVIAVAPDAVAAAAEACGSRGAQALAVVTDGLDDAAQADLLSVCRRYGMRLAGPGCRGIAVPGASLDATLAARHPVPGTAGLITQSGGRGLALADQLSRLGIGISSFVSVGGALDISVNDLLLWWEHDGTTRLAIVDVESFGNPRKFARTARRVAVTIPVLTVNAGHSAELFEQAGVIAATGMSELTGIAALLAAQPVPQGRRIAVISNGDRAAALAAEACSGLGLTVARPRGVIRSRLRTIVPAGGSVSGPVDLTATTSPAAFRDALELVAASPDIDAVIALVQPAAVDGDLVAAVREANVSAPLAVVVLDQAQPVRFLDGQDGRRIPAYNCPEAAARALARAAAYGEWRAETKGEIPAFPDTAARPARELIRRFLARVHEGGWLPAGETADLLRSYGLSLQPTDTGRTTVSAGIASDDVFGQLVFLSSDGASRAEGLVPLTTTDADRLISSAHADPRLRDLLLRVSRLADDLPQIAELSLDSVIVGPQGVFAAAARIRVMPAEPADPFLRSLR
jgi:acyl-CoA synthetase (NDP forming)/GNAT superfamily N-acetyltransferase